MYLSSSVTRCTVQLVDFRLCRTVVHLTDPHNGGWGGILPFSSLYMYIVHFRGGGGILPFSSLYMYYIVHFRVFCKR